jgi:hypothetical protein
MTGIFEKLKTTDERWERYLFATYCRPGPGLDGPSTVQAPCKRRPRAMQGPRKDGAWADLRNRLCLQHKWKNDGVGGVGVENQADLMTQN